MFPGRPAPVMGSPRASPQAAAGVHQAARLALPPVGRRSPPRPSPTRSSSSSSSRPWY